jgi:hypothetical protein
MDRWHEDEDDFAVVPEPESPRSPSHRCRTFLSDMTADSPNSADSEVDASPTGHQSPAGELPVSSSVACTAREDEWDHLAVVDGHWDDAVSCEDEDDEGEGDGCPPHKVNWAPAFRPRTGTGGDVAEMVPPKVGMRQQASHKERQLTKLRLWQQHMKKQSRLHHLCSIPTMLCPVPEHTTLATTLASQSSCSHQCWCDSAERGPSIASAGETFAGAIAGRSFAGAVELAAQRAGVAVHRTQDSVGATTIAGLGGHV